MTNTHSSSCSPFLFFVFSPERRKKPLNKDSPIRCVQLDRTLHCKCAPAPLFRSDGQGVVWVHAHMHARRLMPCRRRPVSPHCKRGSQAGSSVLELRWIREADVSGSQAAGVLRAEHVQVGWGSRRCTCGRGNWICEQIWSLKGVIGGPDRLERRRQLSDSAVCAFLIRGVCCGHGMPA